MKIEPLAKAIQEANTREESFRFTSGSFLLEMYGDLSDSDEFQVTILDTQKVPDYS